MTILIINSGSSSIKYQLIKMPTQEVLCKGQVERIGLDEPKISHKSSTSNSEKIIVAHNHRQALESMVDVLKDTLEETNSTVDAVGHRVVHGGSYFSKTVEIDDAVKDKIESLFSLAPLHNPSNLIGINIAEDLFPEAKQVAVFDTAFHQTIPEVAYTYAIPKEWSEAYNIRLYGFHGTSHKYVSEKATDYLKLNNSKLITIHLGNGCSITAIKDGVSIDHSLGFGPMNGLVMGTRSGDIDQSVIFYLMDKLNLTTAQMNNWLQKNSGMLGLTGYSDFRDIEQEAQNGNQDCQLALEINAYRIKKYIGSYIAAMNGLDAIVFTAGIGENSAFMRKLVCENLDCFGIEIDDKLNSIRTNDIREINKANSKQKILVIPTNEELEIAKQVYSL
ncbi:MAG: acetate kinase [Winogradskyella sp.]|uniref:acetate/propionate family kinase n=1 Tax=Winogradskyella sp. TaxID=1883156 RepID=UPI0025D21F52|nr:acetate kinase [Winogradskyella sp.]NRB58519.1 acetate kinase [Winogradskyella sp.]